MREVLRPNIGGEGEGDLEMTDRGLMDFGEVVEGAIGNKEEEVGELGASRRFGDESEGGFVDERGLEERASKAEILD